MTLASSITANLTRQAHEARGAAVDAIASQLQHPEDIKRLQALQNDFQQKQQGARTQLSASISSQLDMIRLGIDKIEASARALGVVQTSFQEIDELCLECMALIENHEKIQLLSCVQRNLRKTLVDVENIAELPQEAAAAEELMRDNSQLLQAYQCLATLEGTATLAQLTLDGIGALNQQELQKLSLYFDRVKATMQRFEERIFSLLRNFIEIGRQNPAMLVSVMRIVEMQQLVDRQIEASAHGLQPKEYLRRGGQQIGICIQDLFASLMQECNTLAAMGASAERQPSAILTQAQQLVLQLTDIYDNIVPCFPPAHNMFDTIFLKFHDHLARMVDRFGSAAATLSNNDILQVIAWVGSYQQTCADLGVPDEQSAMKQDDSSGMPLLISQYAARTYELLHNWSLNILQADMKAEPRMAEDGHLWTPGAVDFFRTINEQINVVEEHTGGQLLHQTAQAALTVVDEFQEAQKAFVRQGLAVDLMCAVVNNSSRCYDDSVMFTEHMEAVLADDWKGQLALDEHAQGFLALAKLATSQVGRSIFEDPALREQLGKVGGSEEWLQGGVVDVVLATLEDYLSEYQQYLEPAFAPRLVAVCLKEVLLHYLAAFLSGVRSFSEQSSSVMDADISSVTAFFTQLNVPAKVVEGLQPMSDAKELASADSVEAFVLSYSSLLAPFPYLQPAMIEKVLLARADIDKGVVKEALNQCQEVFQQKQQLLGTKPPAAAARSFDMDAILLALRTKDA